ncbi:MAG TPA: radical SAM protein [Pyrinomonadaceae bacterium]|jgi:hypothetical protein
MSGETPLKTSIFVFSTASRLVNNLTNRFYEYDPEAFDLLRRLSNAPADFETLTSSNPDPGFRSLLEYLIREQMIVPASRDETPCFVPHRVDIETCRQCNARCRFCPQSVSPKPPEVMPLELFGRILSRLDGASPEWVALNHYGEPLLDPHFRERVRMLRARGLPLYLFTNGTLLKDATVDFLCEGGLYEVTFNFPSLDPGEWGDLMQMKERFYWNARRGVERFLSRGGGGGRGASISVNGRTANAAERVARLREHFSAFGPVRIIREDSNSRASAIENQLVRIDARSAGRRYGGCERFVAHLHVSWEGKVYLCCQDYEQRTVLGDLRESDISSIMASDFARRLRAEVFGQSAMAAGRLCLNCNKLRTERFPL